MDLGSKYIVETRGKHVDKYSIFQVLGFYV